MNSHNMVYKICVYIFACRHKNIEHTRTHVHMHTTRTHTHINNVEGRFQLYKGQCGDTWGHMGHNGTPKTYMSLCLNHGKDGRGHAGAYLPWSLVHARAEHLWCFREVCMWLCVAAVMGSLGLC